MGAQDSRDLSTWRLIPVKVLEPLMFQNPVDGANAVGPLRMTNRSQVIEIGAMLKVEGRQGQAPEGSEVTALWLLRRDPVNERGQRVSRAGIASATWPPSWAAARQRIDPSKKTGAA